MITKKEKETEKEAKALSFDLAEKLENGEASIEKMLKEIDKFLTKQK